MKKYIVMTCSVDKAVCDDDGFIECAKFGLASPKAYDSKEDALVVRRETIKSDLAEFAGIWKKADGYSFDVCELPGYDVEVGDACVDVYYGGEVIAETVYRISEVEC